MTIGYYPKVDPTFDAIDAILAEVNGASPVDAKQTATRYVGVATEKVRQTPSWPRSWANFSLF